MSIIYINPYQFAAVAGPTDPDFANVSLLLHGDGANGSTTIIDSSPSPKTVTAFGNAQISTTQSKFGGASIAFDGSGDYLIVTENEALEPGGSDLTWEMWINTDSSTRYATLYSRTPAAFSTGMWSLLMNNNSNTSGDVALYAGDYSSTLPLLSTSGVSVRGGAWHHVAVVRNGTAWALYVDGTSRSTNTWSVAISDIAGAVYIGRDQFYGRDFNGYIDDLRITKGVARYTSNFTPPTAPFPDA